MPEGNGNRIGDRLHRLETDMGEVLGKIRLVERLDERQSAMSGVLSGLSGDVKGLRDEWQRRSEADRLDEKEKREVEAAERRSDRRMYIGVTAASLTALCGMLVGLVQAGVIG